MKVTQVIKEAITARVKAKCDEANKNTNLLLNVELDRLAEERKQRVDKLKKCYVIYTNIIHSICYFLNDELVYEFI